MIAVARRRRAEQRSRPDHPHRDEGSVLLITFILITVCGILIAGSLTYVATVLRSHPAVEERSVAVESATSAMRAAILMQVAKGPEGCVDSDGLPSGTFDSNGMDTAVQCTVLEAKDSSRNRYSVITTQTDAARRGLSGWLGTSSGGSSPALKDIDGDVFVNGGWLTKNTQDILVRGNSGNRYRIEYSNSTESAPGVSPPRQPTAARYRIDDTVLDCDGAAAGEDGYPTAASPITGQSYGHVTPTCSSSTEAPLSNGVAWWERAGDDLDPSDDDAVWQYPRLPALPTYDRDGKYVDLTPSCRLYYPGRYDDPLTISGDARSHYFASGVYVFSQPITITDGAEVVFGAGRVAGCGVDSDLALNPAALTNHGITGKGATLLLDGAARLTVQNAAVTINRRVSTPATRGSEGIAIRTVNLGVSSTVLQVPRDSVQQGEYPCLEASPGLCSTPLVPNPANPANSVDVAAHEITIPTKPAPTVLRYSGSSLAHNDNAVLVDFTGSTSQERSSFETDGVVFVPNAQMVLRTASSGPAERLYSFLVNGGVVSSRLLLDARQLPLDPIDNWYVGVQSQATQLRVALKAVASIDGGRSAVSRSVIETRADNSYAINSWTVDADDSGASDPIVTTLPPVTTTPLPTTPTTVAPSSLCPTINGWKAQFYNSPDLAGAVVLCRDEAAINVDWGAGGPGSPVGVDGFSARYTRSVTFGAGPQRFTISADDGYRLLIDGEVVAGCWCDSGVVNETVDVDLSAGPHTIVFEYRDIAGNASAALSWGAVPPPTTSTAATTTSSSSTTSSTTTTLPPAGTCPTTVNGWKGEYYASTDLSGARVLCRDDADLSFWWGVGSPHASVPIDLFSVRWTRTTVMDAGRYRLSVASDDGVRVWVNGELRIDRWFDRGYSQDTADLTLQGGQTTVVVEYYENNGEAGAALWWDPLVANCPSASGTDWVGEFYASMDLSGHRVVCRLDPVLGFAWGYDPPDPMVPTDFFSARWTRTADFVAGTHRFEMNSDDGVRLYIDGNLVKADWTGGPNRYNVVDVPLTAGAHTITLEYFENNGPANVDLTWRQVGCPTVNGWSGQYFANSDLSGDWVLCRDDASPNFDWGTGSPGPGVPADNFSVRWTRTQDFAAGRYRFDLGADNGSRLYVDGTLVRDFWGPTAGYQTTFAEVDLTAGNHTIVYEYREQAGSARSALNWALTPCQGLSGWRGEYYNNTSLNGSPAACRNDATINFSWSSAPITGVPSDNFSVRWTKTITSTGGLYRFRTDIDDGYRLYVDGKLVADHGSTLIETVDVALSPGPHLVTLEMWDTANTARARLTWTPVGRYVRVQLANQDYLHMAEVRVNGVNSTGGQAQRAQGRPAIQSSTHQTAAAGRAVDGNTNGTYNSGSVQHTNFDWNAWWQVDLGSAFGVNTVEVWNRTDCCGFRMSNYTVFVSPTDMGSQTYAQLLANPDVVKITSTVAPAPNRVHTFTRNN